MDKLKKKAAELLPLAIVTEAAVTTKDERHKYKLGRIYLPGFVKSFEYTSASFGLPPPGEPCPSCWPTPSMAASRRRLLKVRLLHSCVVNLH